MDVKPLNFFQLMKRVAIREKETTRLFRTALDTGFYSDGWLVFALDGDEKKSLKDYCKGMKLNVEPFDAAKIMAMEGSGPSLDFLRYVNANINKEIPSLAELVSATQKKTLLRADYYATLTKRFKGATFYASSFDADWPVKPLVLRYDDPEKPQSPLAVVAPYVLE